MAKITPFERYTERYERWFDRNKNLYLSEVRLLKNLLEGIEFEKALEVGIGTGRFALPLGVQYGIDPSEAMLKVARQRGLKVAKGIAESLPVKSSSVELVLMVTTICFVDDPIKTLKEVERVLTHEGYFLIGFVDRGSFLGELYEEKKEKSPFYGIAEFYPTDGVIEMVEKHTSLRLVRSGQTLFGTENILYPVKEGYGEGGFVGLLFKRDKAQSLD